MSARPSKLLLSVAAAAALAGCGLTDPYARQHHATASARRTTPTSTQTSPSPRAGTTPEATLEAFAEAWASSSAATINPQDYTLHELATPGYARQLQAIAARAQA